MKLQTCPSLSGKGLSPDTPLTSDFSLKESIIGTQSFPIAIYEDDLTTLEVAWHWHEEFEIGFVTSGTIKLQTGCHTHTLHEGDVFFTKNTFYLS